MAFTAIFLPFAKRENSTLQPAVSPLPTGAVSLSVSLKDNTSIINPTLQVYNQANFNPSNLNYCYISKFGRYYFVNDWTYSVGVWEASCSSDPLASFKTEISGLTKYVIRSASMETPSIVDDFYPSLAWQPDYYTDTATFGWSRNFTGGSFVLGLVNNDAQGIGAVSYYYVSYGNLRDFLTYMMKDITSSWSADFTGLTDALYRSIYDPFQYVKSCMFFPFSIWGTSSIESSSTPLKFGNYTSSINAFRIVRDSSDWYEDDATLDLPIGWLSLKGKERSHPFAHLYLVCNPWGIIELDPQDFTNSTQIKVYIYPDLVSGDCFLKVYKIVGSTEQFITQRAAKVSIDIPLSSTTVDAKGLLAGGAGIAGGLASTALGVVTGNPLSAVGGVLATAGGVIGAAASMAPSLSGSIGQTFNGIRALDGDLMLIYQNTYFAPENAAEFGHPLYDTQTLSSLSGYIKCADGDCEINGATLQEMQAISGFLTNGFYLE